jgi:methylmalonyl-CoA mutase N-terminal domain/subunit
MRKATMLDQKPTYDKIDAASALYDKSELMRLADAFTQWEEGAVRKSNARMPETRPQFATQSGIPVKRLYTPLDTAHHDYARDIGFPGEYPYTRGVQATMYRGKPWTMRMFAGFGTAEETNGRFKYLLERGQTGLSCAFDMPTLYGYDHDHEMAAGEFGKCGVAVSSLADMEILFDGIPLDQVTTSMTINSPAAVIWAMYIANAEKRGIPMAALGGTLQNDILKEYIAQKEYLFPPEPSQRLVIDAQVEHGVDLWLPHPRGGVHGGAGTRLHPLGRSGICGCDAGTRPQNRRVRAPAVILLRCAQRLL